MVFISITFNLNYIELPNSICRYGEVQANFFTTEKVGEEGKTDDDSSAIEGIQYLNCCIGII